MVIVSGIETLERAEQNWNTNLPIDTTVDGMTISFRDVHEANAASPITFTELGMTKLYSDEHP